MSDKSSLYSIAIVTCYFGPWPWYFPYFLHSCRFNPTIDFIILTDNENTNPFNYILPDNVILHYITLHTINTHVTRKLGFKVSIKDPYKLCDFKPAYGYIFPQILKGYDYWGHGDIDVIYGNIRNFISEELLKSYEVITARHDFLSGTFTLFKNNMKVNSLFMQSRDYRKVFKSKVHYCFDECNFLWKQIGELKRGQTIFDLPTQIESMTHVVRKLQSKNKLKAFFDFLIVEGRPGKLKWINGQVIFKGKYEALLYHLIKFKKENKPSKVFDPMPKLFHISSKNIYK